MNYKESNMLPKDPVILLSYVNTQLRDNYSSLDAMAEGLDLSKEDLNAILESLKSIGYEYSASQNKFAWILGIFIQEYIVSKPISYHIIRQTRS